MHVLLRYVAGRNRLEYSSQTEADFDFIRNYVNDVFLKPKSSSIVLRCYLERTSLLRVDDEDHVSFGFFVRSLMIALSKELQLSIWIEIHALCQESTKLSV